MHAAPNSIAGRDVSYHLHPNTNFRKHEKEGPLVMVRGDGVRVYDDTGKEYIEGLSGLWCASLGFSEKRLVEAAKRQLDELPYYHAFRGRTTPVVAELAERLVNLAPVPMSKVFFAGSGSEANDTAIKLVWYYQEAKGLPGKRKVLSRRNAYHGVTIATASLTGLPINHAGFGLPLPGFVHAACPFPYKNANHGETEDEFATRLAEELEELILRENPDTIGGFIAEPIMGAGGVIVPPEMYFEKIQVVLRKYGILAIADEVICGFGRTGNMFGSETMGYRPDILTAAKGLSSGYQPISAVMITDEVYQCIADKSAQNGTFGHGFTYSAHPVAAAVALETLKIYEEIDVVQSVRAKSPLFFEGLNQLLDHPMVGEVRGRGLIAAVELTRDKSNRTPFEPKDAVPAYLVDRAQEHGLIMRPIGNAAVLCPPLIISEQDIREVHRRFTAALDDTYKMVVDKRLI